MLPLNAFGERIMVLGPSNAGKSSLALALGEARDLPVVHLDQLAHLPHTDWEPRPRDDFHKLHDLAIREERWVIEGNYSRLIPARLERATGALLITSNRWLRLARYTKRTLINASGRAGHLEGGKDRVKWQMIDWILFKTPNNAKKYARMIEAVPIPTIACGTIGELKALYKEWRLRFPG